MMPLLCFQLELGSGQVRNLNIQSQFGAQLAGLGLQLKDSPLATELRGNLWHSWLWLQERGFPQTMEVKSYAQSEYLCRYLR